MPRTYKKRKPKTGLEQYTASSPWKRRLIWLYYLGHPTKDGAKQGLSCKLKEEKGDPTIGGVEQYKSSGNIKTYCSQTSFYDQGKVSALSLSLSRRALYSLTIILFSFFSVSFYFFSFVLPVVASNRTLDKLPFFCMLMLKL